MHERKLIKCAGICINCFYYEKCPEYVKEIFRNIDLEISIEMEELLKTTDFIELQDISIHNLICTVQILEEDEKESLQIIKDSLCASSQDFMDSMKSKRKIPDEQTLSEKMYAILINYMAMKILMIALNKECKSHRKNCYDCFVSEKCQFSKKEKK